MESNQNHQPENVPPPSTEFGSVQNDAESFRTVPNDSERFRNMPHVSERKENHTLTVREAARTFETAGVARTERSITNWCQPNRTGVARLDAYFDPNERKYFITPQSVELAIAEEIAKAAKNNDTSEPNGTIPKRSETVAYSDVCRTVILISVGQGSDFCRTPFRFLSDRVPGGCRTVLGPD